MTLNTVSEQLKQHALQAPFLLEKHLCMNLSHGDLEHLCTTLMPMK